MSARIYPYSFFIIGQQIYDILLKYYGDYVVLNVIYFAIIFGTFVWLFAIEIIDDGYRMRLIFIGYLIVVSIRLVLNVICIGCNYDTYNWLVNNVWVDLGSWIVLFIFLMLWLRSRKSGIFG